MLRVVRGDGRGSWGILDGRVCRRIDPHRRGQRFWSWRPVDEALGMGGVRGAARTMANLEHLVGAPIVHVGWRQIAQAAVMVRVVVPREEIVADATRVLERAKSIRELRSVFEGAELGFGERIVIAHARP